MSEGEHQCWVPRDARGRPVPTYCKTCDARGVFTPATRVVVTRQSDNVHLATGYCDACAPVGSQPLLDAAE